MRRLSRFTQVCMVMLCISSTNLIITITAELSAIINVALTVPRYVNKSDDASFLCTYPSIVPNTFDVTFTKDEISMYDFRVENSGITRDSPSTDYLGRLMRISSNTSRTTRVELLLSVLNITDSSSNYRCYVTTQGDAGNSSDTSLTVEIPPVAKILGGNNTCNEDEPLNSMYECRVTEASPNFRLTWFVDDSQKGSREDGMGGPIYYHSLPLSANCPSRNKSTTDIACRIEWWSGNSPRTVFENRTLQIHYAPYTYVSGPHPNACIIGRQVTLNCLVDPPVPDNLNVTWYRNDTEISQASNFQLNLTNITPTADDGYYTCRGYNGVPGAACKTGYILRTLVPPGKPELFNIRSNNLTSNSVLLTWKKSAILFAVYRLEYRNLNLASGEYTLVQDCISQNTNGSLEFGVQGLKKDTQYEFRLTARLGCTDISALESEPATLTVTTVDEPILTVTGVTLTEKELRVTWSIAKPALSNIPYGIAVYYSPSRSPRYTRYPENEGTRPVENKSVRIEHSFESSQQHWVYLVWYENSWRTPAGQTGVYGSPEIAPKDVASIVSSIVSVLVLLLLLSILIGAFIYYKRRPKPDTKLPGDSPKPANATSANTRYEPPRDVTPATNANAVSATTNVKSPNTVKGQTRAANSTASGNSTRTNGPDKPYEAIAMTAGSSSHIPGTYEQLKRDRPGTDVAAVYQNNQMAGHLHPQMTRVSLPKKKKVPTATLR